MTSPLPLTSADPEAWADAFLEMHAHVADATASNRDTMRDWFRAAMDAAAASARKETAA